MMSKPIAAAALAALTLTAFASARASPDANQPAAVAAASRLKADTDRDAAQKPAEMLEFAGLLRGMAVADFSPGLGYWPRLFSGAVGPEGRVYALLPEPPLANGIASDRKYPTITVIAGGATKPLPEKVDVVWTAKHFRDLYRGGRKAAQDQARAAFADLKPGGVFIVWDHRASTAMPIDQQVQLKRIDPAVVRADVVAAGFRFEAESQALANPADDFGKASSDPAVSGRTDQFIYRFRKPR